MLKELRLVDVGPVADLDARLTRRLNVLTGDNGLGKSFFLDVAWWALTGTWAGGRVAYPEQGRKKRPRIHYHVRGKKGAATAPKTAVYTPSAQSWVHHRGRPIMPGLVLYARVDGSFSVWDPAKNYWRNVGTGEVEALDYPPSYDFSSASLWEGLREPGRTLCNGLIHDWVYWQNQPPNGTEVLPFTLLSQVLRDLSHPEEAMEPGPPTRLYIDDTRMYPTVRMPYGMVPLTHAAAGVRRIASLAYLLVWAWDEHTQASRLRDEDPTDRLVLLLDEVEAHLHPKWQRTLLPALLGVANRLQDRMQVQIICTTHSPLVLASLEPLFDEEIDRLFWFDLQGAKVVFREYPWAKQGDVVSWLTSDIFGLRQARSKEAEEVIEAAEKYMDGHTEDLPEHLSTQEAIQQELARVLPGDDPFLVRWSVKTGAVPQT